MGQFETYFDNLQEKAMDSRIKAVFGNFMHPWQTDYYKIPLHSAGSMKAFND